jgi:sigma-E factor negative regulatory protein RseC
VIESGTVVRASDGSVDVRVESSDHCEACGMCESAGENQMLLLDVQDDVGAGLGDRVDVEVPDGSRLRGTMIGYGVPVLVLALGYLAGFLLGGAVGTDPDLTGAVTAVAAVVAVLVWLRRHGAGIMSAERFRPKVRAIIRRGSPS